MVDRPLNVVLGYRSYAGTPGISHAGLGVSAINTAKVLCRAGIAARTQGFTRAKDFYSFARANPDVTHIIVSALWLKTHELAGMTGMYPNIHFAVVSHSNVSFLAVEHSAIRLLREQSDLAMERYNLKIGANNGRLKHFIEAAYGAPCALFPNLYDIGPLPVPHRPTWFQSRGVLRIGVFGAARQQKNLTTSVAAAVQIGRELNTDVEIFLNSQRHDDAMSRTITRSCEEICRDMQAVRLNLVGWLPWAKFRNLVSSMHITLNASQTESYSMVCGDSMSQGVPALGSPPIEWLPEQWKANPDDVNDVVRKAIAMLADPMASRHGEAALRRYVANGIAVWRNYLTGQDV